jgi:thioredoxin reductase/ferredoxin
MPMLTTTAALVAVTGLSIWWHVRRSAGATTGGASGAACPRCRAAVPAGAMRCPRCGVPQELFEVVAAPVAAAATAGGGVLKAMVRADRCVGCGACAAACPEPAAIALRGHLATVDPAACMGHGECAAACPVGAIAMTAGAAVNRVAVPLVDANFETTVRGLYIVGELGGRGLIKNAINEGRIAIEHVARRLPRPARAAADAGIVDVAIVGSGPAGLSAGLEALKQGLDYVVLEQGTLSDTVRKYPRRKLLLAEPVHIPLYGELWVSDTSKETLLQVWETIVAATGLVVRTGEKVEDVQPDGRGFLLRTSTGTVRARCVVLAMGRRGSPRRLGVPGEDHAKVFYDIVEMEQFRGRRMLVVGGGDSAVESAIGLANQPGTEVTLSYRGTDFARVKPRNREKIERAIAAGRIRVLFESAVREIRADVVLVDIRGATTILPNDEVVIRIGGETPEAFLERLGVRIVQKDIPVARETAHAG